MRVKRLSTGGASTTPSEKPTRDIFGRFLAIIGIVLALINFYYTFVDRTFRLAMVHPESELQITRG
jgi:hypothetical protein